MQWTTLPKGTFPRQYPSITPAGPQQDPRSPTQNNCTSKALRAQVVVMDWQRFDWPAMAGEPDDDWFDYLQRRGWTVSPVPTVARIGSRSYLRYLGWRARAA